MGYGAGQAGVFTSGGTQSNLMGVLWLVIGALPNIIPIKTANRGRYSVMVSPDAMQNVKVLCSQNAHFSVQKNMAMMGMGFASVVSIPVNDNA